MSLSPTHITSNQLADRWRLHRKTLANWRVQGRGPKWFRLPGSRKVLYVLADIERIEASGVAVASGQAGSADDGYCGI